jgi:hypothetical protein
MFLQCPPVRRTGKLHKNDKQLHFDDKDFSVEKSPLPGGRSARGGKIARHRGKGGSSTHRTHNIPCACERHLLDDQGITAWVLFVDPGRLRGVESEEMYDEDKK